MAEITTLREACRMLMEALWMIDNRRYYWADRCLARSWRLLSS